MFAVIRQLLVMIYIIIKFTYISTVKVIAMHAVIKQWMYSDHFKVETNYIRYDLEVECQFKLNDVDRWKTYII